MFILFSLEKYRYIPRKMSEKNQRIKVSYRNRNKQLQTIPQNPKNEACKRKYFDKALFFFKMSNAFFCCSKFWG